MNGVVFTLGSPLWQTLTYFNFIINKCLLKTGPINLFLYFMRVIWAQILQFSLYKSSKLNKLYESCASWNELTRNYLQKMISVKGTLYCEPNGQTAKSQTFLDVQISEWGPWNFVGHPKSDMNVVSIFDGGITSATAKTPTMAWNSPLTANTVLCKWLRPLACGGFDFQIFFLSKWSLKS